LWSRVSRSRVAESRSGEDRASAFVELGVDSSDSQPDRKKPIDTFLLVNRAVG
jgi:hypothetical protein